MIFSQSPNSKLNFEDDNGKDSAEGESHASDVASFKEEAPDTLAPGQSHSEEQTLIAPGTKIPAKSPPPDQYAAPGNLIGSQQHPS